MSDKAKHKSRPKERVAVRHSKKKKSKRRSSSSSEDCVIVNTEKNSSAKEKVRKSKKKRRRSFSSDSTSSGLSVPRLKLGSKQKQLLGERPEFCRNFATPSFNSKNLPNVHAHKFYRSESGERRNYRVAKGNTIDRRIPEGQVKKSDGKKRRRDRAGHPEITKKSKRSRKQRSSSPSSSSEDSSGQSSSTSESSSDSSTSSGGSWERRRRRRRKKKKLAKKMKREEKRRREERKKLKIILKDKSRISPKQIKMGNEKTSEDRLLKDINIELADRARAMAPMTKEQWEKKQNVVRRVYDEETGRHRLIKGDGEVLEEIVSRDRHMAINRQATKGDGEFFQSRLRVNK